jgi:hypothetical protein
MSDTFTDLFAELFEGRLDAFGTEQGGCVYSASEDWDEYVRRIDEHLWGVEPMGVYPMVEGEDDCYVKWGCVDFDEGDEVSFIYAQNLRTVLAQFGIDAWLERSRSKGWHVWVFSSEWVPAYVMRRALLGATDTARAPIKEINPKQEQASKKGVGNYVRLPYPCFWENTLRRCVIDMETREPLEMAEFTLLAHARRCNRELLEKVMGLWTPPAKPKPAPVRHITEPVNTKRMGSLSFHVLRNGPKDDSDRSSALWTLANSLHKDGLNYSEALDVIYEADRRWGKFIERGDEVYLDAMCDKLWGR